MWDRNWTGVSFGELIGKTLSEVTGGVYSDEITFTTSEGEKYRMLHWRDCCEQVRVEDICGDLGDLIGEPIIEAEEVVGDTAEPADWKADEWTDSYTWTFYKIGTRKGSVTIRWLGTSNGYYGEGVDFEKFTGGRE